MSDYKLRPCVNKKCKKQHDGEPNGCLVFKRLSECTLYIHEDCFTLTHEGLIDILRYMHINNSLKVADLTAFEISQYTYGMMPRSAVLELSKMIGNGSRVRPIYSIMEEDEPEPEVQESHSCGDPDRFY
jgi:hypothetical protein